jgi:hypothetical protein
VYRSRIQEIPMRLSRQGTGTNSKVLRVVLMPVHLRMVSGALGLQFED